MFKPVKKGNKKHDKYISKEIFPFFLSHRPTIIMVRQDSDPLQCSNFKYLSFWYLFLCILNTYLFLFWIKSKTSRNYMKLVKFKLVLFGWAECRSIIGNQFSGKSVIDAFINFSTYIHLKTNKISVNAHWQLLVGTYYLRAMTDFAYIKKYICMWC